MARLIYTAIMSLDGYIEDENGGFDWAVPDEEVHRFVNDLERAAGTYLYGRRMYETMQVWETDPSLAAESPLLGDYAGVWQAAEKVVFRAFSDSRMELSMLAIPSEVLLRLPRHQVWQRTLTWCRISPLAVVQMRYGRRRAGI